jgi:hypothetical protein
VTSLAALGVGATMAEVDRALYVVFADTFNQPQCAAQRLHEVVPRE